MENEKTVSFTIPADQKESLIKLISKTVGNTPFITHEKDNGNGEITFTVISASFTQAQQDSLEAVKNDITANMIKKGSAQEVFNLFD